MKMSDRAPPLAEPVSWQGLRALVLGLGRFGGGVAVSRWLAEQGAIVTVTDLATASSLAESLRTLDDLPITFHLGGHDPADLDDADLVIVNPAVSKSRSPFFAEIVRRGIPWTTEMNLFCERCPAPVVGITGTYGKSTTSAMLVAAVRRCVEEAATRWTGVHLGGNIGLSLLGHLGGILPTDLVVLEMSDAQLVDLRRIEWGPVVAVITNLFPHHLGRHSGWEGYVAAKLNIARDPARTRRVFVSPLALETQSLVERILPDGDARLTVVERADPPVDLCVPGAHNRANADCVLAVCAELGLDGGLAREALSSFEGLSHRLQRVRMVDGVIFVNDSKSTSPSATVVAANSMSGPFVAIVGGERKDAPLSEMAVVLARGARAVVCIGAASARMAEAVREAGLGSVHETGALPEGLSAAVELASSGDTVLFSPGAPSFDQYPNFEARGDHFVRLVEAL